MRSAGKPHSAGIKNWNLQGSVIDRHFKPLSIFAQENELNTELLTSEVMPCWKSPFPDIAKSGPCMD